jgi:hypothetical protein
MTACVVLPPQPEFELSGRDADAAASSKAAAAQSSSQSASKGANTTHLIAPSSNASTSPSQAKGGKRIGLGPFKLVVPVVARGASGPLGEEVEVDAAEAAAAAAAGPMDEAGAPNGGGMSLDNAAAPNGSTIASPSGGGGGGGAAAAAAAGAAGGAAGAAAAAAGAAKAAANGGACPTEARDVLAPLRQPSKSILKTATTSSSAGSRTLSWRDEGDLGLELTLIREFERSPSVSSDASDSDDEDGGKKGAAAACCVVS